MTSARSFITTRAAAGAISRNWTPRERRHVEVVLGDVQDPFSTALAVEGCDVVFHLAALIAIPYSYRAAQSYVRTNVEGTLNVLEACRAHGVQRLVHTSTSETYGTAQDHADRRASPDPGSVAVFGQQDCRRQDGGVVFTAASTCRW